METPTAEHAHQRNSHLFAIIGGILVIIGLLALIIGSWSSFTALGRILTSALPLLALYILVFIANQKEAAKPVARYALITASVSLPLVLGVILFQSGVFTEVDATLITTVALISAANSGIIEFLYGDPLHTPLTLISLITAAVALISWLSLDVSGACIVILLTGALMIGIGTIQTTDPRNTGAPAWHSTGAVLLLGSLLMLPFALTKGVIDENVHVALISTGFVVSGLLALLFAVLYSRLWQAQKTQRYLYDVRRLYEYGAAFLLVFPAIVIVFASSFAGVFLILLGASLISLAISTKVRVNWFRTLGLLGMAASIIRLIALGLQDLAAIWPIVLVVAGILFFAIAIFGAHRTSDWTQSLFSMPATSWEKLGEAIEPGTGSKKPAAPQTSGWFWLILSLIILWALTRI